MKAITVFMEQDHDRLDDLLGKFRATKRSEFSTAKQAFAEFVRGLQRHIIWEEEMLFPVFEAHTGAREYGPTAVMRLEHRRIKAALDQIHDRIAQGAIETDEFEKRLIETLAAHNQKEETVLYPWIDNLLSEQDAKDLLARMMELPAERYQQCCG